MAAVLTVTLSASAQYPDLTSEAKALIDQQKKQWKAHSDSAWEVAFPIVIEEAKAGRPYVPWASRPYDLRQAKIPAFPGAEGGGMFTFGGRGGKVLTVTNLNDDGPGSFRWACEQGGARIVVFNVSGIIRLKSPVYVRAPYITIAGQTAPGEGVIIAGESFQVDTHDVIVRHMRFRRGETLVTNREDSFGGNPVGNIMIDHCSCEWGLDENISFYRHMFDMHDGKPNRKEPTVNVTIQNTISAKALDTWNHAFGSTIGGENTTFMRNLWADNTGRNPSIGWGGVFNYINNIVYNWVHRTADGGEFSTMSNFINNYYKPGPLTPKEGPVGHRIVKSESRSQGLFPFKQFGRVYAAGNIMEGYPEITKDNWNGGIQTADKDGEMDATELALMRSNEPFEMPYVNIMGTEQAFDWVLSNAGATIPCRDIVDQRICDEVRTGQAYYVENYEKELAKIEKKTCGEGGAPAARRPPAAVPVPAACGLPCAALAGDEKDGRTGAFLRAGVYGGGLCGRLYAAHRLGRPAPADPSGGEGGAGGAGRGHPLRGAAALRPLHGGLLGHGPRARAGRAGCRRHDLHAGEGLDDPGGRPQGRLRRDPVHRQVQRARL